MKYQDIPGWFTPEHATTLEQLIKEHQIRNVIEIGAYLGRSTVFFMSQVRNTVSIDPFVMWAEGRYNSDAMSDGGEDFYKKFLNNILESRRTNSNLQELTVLRATSEESFKKNPILAADLIFIDAKHDYESVKKDLEMWGLRANKIICGDDYDENWPGVMQAVDEIFPDRIIDGRIWYTLVK